MSELLKEAQVAQMTAMSVYWLRRKRWEGGGIPFVKLGGERGAVRYRREDVESFVSGRVRISTSDEGR